MSSYRYDRLSAQDNTFLVGETPTAHMHIGGTSIFDIGNLRTAIGGLDIAKLRAAVAGVLHRIPRYHQKLKWTPVFGTPVWVDDPDFNLDYHVRHTSLPQPGNFAQLKALSGRVMAQQLDRARPLWEFWFVEGLEGGECFALITKIHHCMIDGKAGVDLVQTLLSDEPVAEVLTPEPYVPRSAPGDAELLRDEALRRVAMPLAALRDFQHFRAEAEDFRAELNLRMRAVGDLVQQALNPPSDTPLNGKLGPHRRFDWLTLALDDVKAVRRAASCTVNDVVLATASGAFRAYLKLRNVDPAKLNFRAAAPVSMRSEEERGALGNRVSSWQVPLPLEVEAPLERLARVRETTSELKEKNHAIGVEMMMSVAEWTPPVLLSLGAQAAGGQVNTIITNVPGPQFPLYMLGARLVNMFPLAPLLDPMGISIALFSYDGKLNWGFVADYNLIPDLEIFVQEVERAFLELAAACEVSVRGALPEGAR